MRLFCTGNYPAVVPCVWVVDEADTGNVHFIASRVTMKAELSHTTTCMWRQEENLILNMNEL